MSWKKREGEKRLKEKSAVAIGNSELGVQRETSVLHGVVWCVPHAAGTHSSYREPGSTVFLKRGRRRRRCGRTRGERGVERPAAGAAATSASFSRLRDTARRTHKPRGRERGDSREPRRISRFFSFLSFFFFFFVFFFFFYVSDLRHIAEVFAVSPPRKFPLVSFILFLKHQKIPWRFLEVISRNWHFIID